MFYYLLFRLEDDLTRLDQEVRELQSMSQHMTEMKMLKESKNTKEAEVRKLWVLL